MKIRGKEIPILYYNYRCHIQHHDDSNLRRIIQLHIQVCEEIGNRENLPVEGDLITLAFECSGDEAFFYDWLNGGTMQDGEIHFIYNEVEVADILRFWDCYCVKIEEYMSVGNAPMMMVVYLSPGIIKRNNLEVREKVWKVSDVSNGNSSSIQEENADQIAGGNFDDVTEMGDKRINSSIGSQWGTKDKGRAQNLEDELLKVLEGPPKIDEEQQKYIKMNVIFAEDLEIIK